MILTVSNYRPFISGNPVSLSMEGGTIALLGPNNVGKSAVLRMFFELRSVFANIGTNLDASWRGRSVPCAPPAGSRDWEAVFTDLNNGPLRIRLAGHVEVEGASQDIVLDVTMTRGGEVSASLSIGSARIQGDKPIYSLSGPGISVLGAERPGRLTPAQKQMKPRPTPKALPAPVVDLSSLKSALSACADTVYIGPHRHALPDGSSRAHFDMPTGSAFVQAWRDMKSGPSREANKAAIQVEKDIRRAFGLESLEVSVTTENVLQLIVNGRPYRFHEVGSGIVQFLLILATVARRLPSYVLVDEPELNLYPRLQVELIAILERYALRGVMFATHSVGLARSVADEIFVVAPRADGTAAMRPLRLVPDPHTILGELSFSVRRELGTDVLLLVEGSTEIKVMQHFLAVLGLADRVALVSLGGGDMIKGGVEDHLRQFSGFTRKVAAIVDSERADSKLPPDQTRLDFAAACKTVGVECHILERRATENYLTDRAIKEAKGTPYRELSPYEQLKDYAKAWPKRDNAKIAAVMTVDEIKNTDLGTFLATL